VEWDDKNAKNNDGLFL